MMVGLQGDERTEEERAEDDSVPEAEGSEPHGGYQLVRRGRIAREL